MTITVQDVFLVLVVIWLTLLFVHYRLGKWYDELIAELRRLHGDNMAARQEVFDRIVRSRLSRAEEGGSND